ncbi:DUF3549 family protein [Thalassotalea fusca]
MDSISTISELLTLSGSQYRVYDIGRRIDKLSKDTFEKFEHNQLPYPYPIQGHACIAIAFWQKVTAQPYLWFVKLPLDERGLLNQGARNHFLAIIIEALGSNLSVDPTEKQEELLQSNPYNFTPPQYKLAFLHSELNQALMKQASQYYQRTYEYFCSTDTDLSQWHDIGVQGISDIVVKAKSDKDIESAIARSLSSLPNEVLMPLSTAIENIQLSADTLSTVIDYHDVAAQEVKPYLIRCLASSSTHLFVQAFLAKLMAEKTLSDEIVITLAGRCWSSLANTEMMSAYLEHLARKDNLPLFQAIFKDLVAIPELRQVIFSCMRSSERSAELATAIGSLFNAQ